MSGSDWINQYANLLARDIPPQTRMVLHPLRSLKCCCALRLSCTRLWRSLVVRVELQLAKQYDPQDHIFKEGDFTDEELRKNADSVFLENISPAEDVDIDDPAVRSAFGLD